MKENKTIDELTKTMEIMGFPRQTILDCMIFYDEKRGDYVDSHTKHRMSVDSYIQTLDAARVSAYLSTEQHVTKLYEVMKVRS